MCHDAGVRSFWVMRVVMTAAMAVVAVLLMVQADVVVGALLLVAVLARLALFVVLERRRAAGRPLLPRRERR